MWAVLSDSTSLFYASHARYLELHEDHIQLKFGGQRDGLLPSGCFPDQLLEAGVAKTNSLIGPRVRVPVQAAGRPGGRCSRAGPREPP